MNPLVILLGILILMTPFAGAKGVFDINDGETMSMVLGPFAHFFMPLLGFFSLRSLIFAPLHMIEDWISTMWPIGALYLLFLSSDVETITDAMNDVANSTIYRVFEKVSRSRIAVPAISIAAGLMACFSGFFTLFTVLLDFLPYELLKGLGAVIMLPVGVPMGLLWPIPALLLWFTPLSNIFLGFGNHFANFLCGFIPGVRIIFRDFLEKNTGVPVISLFY